MKNVLLVLFVLTATVFTSNLQAQTTCTPAQKEACKKISANQAKCTPEQVAACKKICSTKTASSKAVKVVNQSPSTKTSCNKNYVAKNASEANDNPIKLVGLSLLPEGKKETACSKPCEKKKE